MKIYIFSEPHITGGYAIIEITEKQILSYMKDIASKKKEYQKLSDEQLIDEFIIVNWCTGKI